jgi:hypothetical protein
MLKSLKWTVVHHPLRSPAFLRLWLGLSISSVGDQFTTIALLWFVLQRTRSGAAIRDFICIGQKYERSEIVISSLT